MYIKELEKNKYRVWVNLDPDYTGKRRRKSKVIQAKTKRELQAKINEWTESINNISDCKTVSDMCNEVWPQIVANKSPIRFTATMPPRRESISQSDHWT